MTHNPLFAEFEAVSFEKWYETTLKSLKGKDFETLLTDTYEGIILQPLYRQTDTADMSYPDTLPGEAPFVRGIHPENRVWWIAGNLPYADPEQYNQALQGDIARGQTAIFLDTRNTRIQTLTNFETAFQNVDLSAYPLFIKTDLSPVVMILLLRQQEKSVKGYLNSDVLAQLAQTGNCPISMQAAYDELHMALQQSAELPDFRVLMVDTSPYHHAGANAVQELAFMLATGAAYLRAMLERGLDVDDIAKKMCANFAIGTQLFMEIAKLRAARLLWQQLIAAFGGDEHAQKLTIHAETSRYNKTISDAHNNILRTTLETFAAAAGGVQSLIVQSFDSLYQQPDDFSRRIARNQQLILQQEVNLTRLTDPMSGAWYGEVLTDELAKRAWTLFQKIEAQGGMLAALNAGFPQQQCAETAAKRLENLRSGRDVLVGTTKYQNTDAPLPKINLPEITDISPSDDAKIAIAGRDDVEGITKALLEGATLQQINTALRQSADPVQITALDMHRLEVRFQAN